MGTDWRGVTSGRNAPGRDFKLEPPQEFRPSAWFLGPNAENQGVFEELIAIALSGNITARIAYQPNDPNMAPGAFPRSGPTVERMKENLRHILDELRGSIPLSSHRNQSHMYWDITMPGAAGYFAGMLFNQNNVAAEASPVTTALEIRVARELCEMLGYGLPAAPEPWGHITCDGSVANSEALWAARNLKYQAAALARAILADPELLPARGVSVRKPDGSWARLLDLTTWEQLNLATDEVLALRGRLVKEGGLTEAQVAGALNRYSIQSKGAAAFDAEVLHGAVKTMPAILVPATAHYSWPKAAALLGLGTHSVQAIPVDLEGRMIVSELAQALNRCLDEQRPVLAVVAVLGSTGESAVDPLCDVLALREQFAARGLTFALHVDAAWGGYFASMLRPPATNAPPADDEQTGLDETPEESLSDYVQAQFHALHHADSITVDPHKAGYIPYPAGALCYRNREMIYLVAHTSPVVFHDGEAPTVGVYGIEGSKPGAAAVGVALSHVTIPTNALGYGRLLGRCVFNSKRFYAALTTLAGPDDDFIVVPFQRLPAERDGGDEHRIEAQRKLIRERIVPHENPALMEILDTEPEIRKLFRSLGPDLTVFAYAFNFKLDGRLNTDLVLMNAFNNALFHRLSIERPEIAGHVPPQPMFVTSSQFDPASHGAAFMKHFADRAGLDYSGGPIRYLISTMQNPFLTATAEGNFIKVLMTVYRATIEEVRAELVRSHAPDPKES